MLGLGFGVWQRLAAGPGGPETTPEVEVLWDDGPVLLWDDGAGMLWD